MSEEATQDTGSQEVASAAAPAAPANFLESLPEDLRDNPSLRNFTDAGSLAKSYVHARSMIGADSIGKPQQSWTPDQYTQFYAETGRPKNASDYQLDFDVDVDDNDLSALQQAMFDAGLAPRQAQTIVQYLNAQAQNAFETNDQYAEQAVNTAIDELKSEYGQAYDQKTKMAYNAATMLLGQDKLAMFEDVILQDGRKLGDHPDIVRMFVTLGEQIGEDSLFGEPTELIMTPEQARAELKEVTRLDGPYGIRDHPEHDAYVKKAQELFQLAS